MVEVMAASSERPYVSMLCRPALLQSAPRPYGRPLLTRAPARDSRTLTDKSGSVSCGVTYDYTVEVTNRFKGLNLPECLKNYGQRFVTLYRRQWSKPSLRKRNAKSQNGCLRRPYKSLRKEVKWKAKEKRKDIPIWMQSSKEEQEDVKSLPKLTMQRNRGKQ